MCIFYCFDKVYFDKKLIFWLVVDVLIVFGWIYYIMYNLKFCCLNVRLLWNKFVEFVCYVGIFSVDIVVIIEIWFIVNDIVYCIVIIFLGCKLLDCLWFGCVGGEIVFLVWDNIFVIKGDVGEWKLFEFFEWIVKYGFYKLWVIVIYCLLYLSNYLVILNVFFDEFLSYLELIVMLFELFLIVGDFNIYVDVLENLDGVCFFELFEFMGL